MRHILGIDTGGTYTDGVILSLPDGHIAAKTKTPTTHSDLCACIRSCISSFSSDERAELSQICLSTTLATNALVEGNGCSVGLLLLGGCPNGRLPTQLVQTIPGQLDILGRVREPLDLCRVDEAIESFRGKVQAVAISGYASVRNPEHEICVRERVHEKLSVPTACAHELTAALGFYDRTVTTVLNARLIPLLCRLIGAVHQVLCELQITTPLMIVRGDGTLMSAEQACRRPIETVSSGPAASIAGGLFLSGEQDAFVLDMGGTTTDIAHVTAGMPCIRTDGASIGGWFTRVRAAEVYTVGLGGDSRIQLNCDKQVIIGPERAIPFCVAAQKHPNFAEELHMLLHDPEQPFRHFQQNDYEAFLLEQPLLTKDDADQSLFGALEHGPHTLYQLRQQIGLPDLAARTDRLVHAGALSRIALTPTDLLHAEGSYTHWNADAATRAVELYAARDNLSVAACIKKIRQSIDDKIAQACLESSFYFDRQTPASHQASFDRYFTNLLLGKGSNLLCVQPSLSKCVVAIGAPASAWVGSLKSSLNARIIYPLHAEVAGAVGAAAGHILERANVLIRPDPVTQQYTVFSAACRHAFPTLEAATDFARETGCRFALSRLPEGQADVSTSIRDLTVDGAPGTPKTLAERQVSVIAARRFSDNTSNCSTK